jgi:hypothetical protein
MARGSGGNRPRGSDEPSTPPRGDETPAAGETPVVAAPPELGEYSPGTIRKKVIETGLSHPATLYPVAFGVGSAVAGWILGTPALYLVALSGLLGPVWAVIQIFFRSESLGRRYLQQLDERRERYTEQLKAKVRDGLEGDYGTTQANECARQGRDQFDRAARTLSGIRELLEIKLNTMEITFLRFQAAAEQTYLAVIDSLKDVVALLKSADSIDPDHVRQQLARMGNAEAQPSAAHATSREALTARLRLWTEQMDKAAAMLAKNEQAITAMEEISARVADWQTDQRFATTDVEAAIGQLQELARFAHEIDQP